MPWLCFSQSSGNIDSNSADTTANNLIEPDHGEAGGIDANEIGNAKNATDFPYAAVAIGLVIGLIGGFILRLATAKKQKENTMEENNDSKLFIDESVIPGSNSKEFSAADAKKLKEEMKQLKQQLAESRTETAAYKKN